MDSGADSRRPTADDLCYQFCHSLRFLAGIVLNGLNNRSADCRGVGKLAHSCKVLGLGDTESHSDREFGEFSQPLHEFLRVIGQIFSCASYSRARYRIDESSGGFGDSLQPLIRAGWPARNTVTSVRFRIWRRYSSASSTGKSVTRDPSTPHSAALSANLSIPIRKIGLRYVKIMSPASLSRRISDASVKT